MTAEQIEKARLARNAYHRKWYRRPGNADRTKQYKLKSYLKLYERMEDEQTKATDTGTDD